MKISPSRHVFTASHITVVSLQKQLSVCVQQPDKPNILVDYSDNRLQEMVGYEASQLLETTEGCMLNS